MERIYHRYEYWECFKNGFFKNKSGVEKIELGLKVLELFNNPKETEIYMKRVLNEWIYSCEHNLSNLALNRVAWLGQSACCIYAKVPYQITMENWRLVDDKNKIIDCEIAENLIKEWELNQNTKQLCLKLI